MKIKRRCKCGCGNVTNKGKKTYVYCHNSYNKGSNNGNYKHGLRSHPLYHTWNNMKQRCYNPKHIAYKRYGGRGIRVCIRWRLSFTSFLKDIEPRPKGLTLDRMDNDGNYTPSNCRWATRLEQARNRCDNIIITYKSKTMDIVED